MTIRTVKFLLTVVFIFEIIFLVLFYLLIENNQEFKNEIIAKKQEQNEKMEKIDKFKDFEGNFEKLFEQKKGILEKRVNKDNVAEIISKIEEIAKQRDVDLKIKTQNQIISELAEEEPEERLMTNDISKLRLYLITRSEWEDILYFLHDLENIPKFIVVEEVKIWVQEVDVVDFSFLNEEEIKEYIEENSEFSGDKRKIAGEIIISF